MPRKIEDNFKINSPRLFHPPFRIRKIESGIRGALHSAPYAFSCGELKIYDSYQHTCVGGELGKLVLEASTTETYSLTPVSLFCSFSTGVSKPHKNT